MSTTKSYDNYITLDDILGPEALKSFGRHPAQSPYLETELSNSELDNNYIKILQDYHKSKKKKWDDRNPINEIDFMNLSDDDQLKFLRLQAIYWDIITHIKTKYILDDTIGKTISKNNISDIYFYKKDCYNSENKKVNILNELHIIDLTLSILKRNFPNTDLGTEALMHFLVYCGLTTRSDAINLTINQKNIICNYIKATNSIQINNQFDLDFKNSCLNTCKHCLQNENFTNNTDNSLNILNESAKAINSYNSSSNHCPLDRLNTIQEYNDKYEKNKQKWSEYQVSKIVQSAVIAAIQGLAFGALVGLISGGPLGAFVGASIGLYLGGTVGTIQSIASLKRTNTTPPILPLYLHDSKNDTLSTLPYPSQINDR
ncbi:glycine zipper family protein [Thiotrichales bacterium 19S3-7]|nr:glycine zipper family protein [Thiotrichales bacterium 19S3-7]MCF6802621.1 glycine zipper family protein [Thiotrichales bacterium 19S3-11]